MDGSIFSSGGNTPTIYVPNNSVEAYKTAEGWKQYAKYIMPQENKK